MKKQSKKQRSNLIKITARITPREKRMWDAIERKSEFIRLALDNAIGIMEWDNLKRGGYKEPKHPDYRKVIRTYNLNHRTEYKTKYIEVASSENSPKQPANW